MSAAARTDFREILKTLHAHGVEAIVVGGISAALHGAPVTTFDLDLLHSTEAANVQRLLAALEELDAVYRLPGEKRLRPLASHLCSPGRQRLMTRFGPLDLPGSIGRSRRYEDLLPHTVEMEIGGGVRARVLDLETLIVIKEETARDTDLAVLPILRRTLEERRR